MEWESTIHSVSRVSMPSFTSPEKTSLPGAGQQLRRSEFGAVALMPRRIWCDHWPKWNSHPRPSFAHRPLESTGIAATKNSRRLPILGQGSSRMFVAAGMRVVQVRIGVVLSTQGGALTKMLTPFRLGLGGIVGAGTQYWSWVGLQDLVGVLQEAVTNNSLRGPINAVSPQPVTNREFTKILGKVLKRPTIFPLPGFVAKLLLGEMAEELLLSSAKVVPESLKKIGFKFRHADLETCLRHELS